MKTKRFSRLKKILKWSLIIIVSYIVLDIVYTGYGSLDSKTGMTKFFWSGLDDINSKDKASGFVINKHYPTFLRGIDGPYIVGNKRFDVTDKNEVVETTIDSARIIKVVTNMKEFPEFEVTLRDHYPAEPVYYELPEKVIAISDIEGNLTGFYSFLLANKVIDKKGNWIFGKNHLVLNGDFFDRGSQVCQLLWFIYHLENEAGKKGGKVHYILGNHEVMNLAGNASDNDFKYIEIAKRISHQKDWNKAVLFLYSENAELGKWLRSKNIVEKIGHHIFVHGGLNKWHAEEKITIPEMNVTARKYLGQKRSAQQNISKNEALITDHINSPYWDRRLNLDWKINLTYKLNGIDAEKTTPADLNKILQFYNGQKIIIGHSIVNDISTGYDNKVIKIDVSHGEKPNSGRTKGLLIENENYYKVDDAGGKSILFD